MELAGLGWGWVFFLGGSQYSDILKNVIMCSGTGRRVRGSHVLFFGCKCFACVGGAFAAGVFAFGGLVTGSVQLLRETRLAVRQLEIRSQNLRARAEEWQRRSAG